MNEFCIIKSIKSKIDAPVIAQDNILASKQSELYLYWTGKNEESIVQHTDSDICKISNLCIKPWLLKAKDIYAKKSQRFMQWQINVNA